LFVGQRIRLVIESLHSGAVDVEGAEGLAVCNTVLVVAPIPHDDEGVALDGVQENEEELGEERTGIEVVSEEAELGVLVVFSVGGGGSSRFVVVFFTFLLFRFTFHGNLGGRRFTGRRTSGNIFASFNHGAFSGSHNGCGVVLFFIRTSDHRLSSTHPQHAGVPLELGAVDGGEARNNEEVAVSPAHTNGGTEGGDTTSDEDGDHEELDEEHEAAEDLDGDGAGVPSEHAGDELLGEDVDDDELQGEVLVVLLVEGTTSELAVVGAAVPENGVVTVEVDNDGDDVPQEGDEGDDEGEDADAGNEALEGDEEGEGEGKGHEDVGPRDEGDFSLAEVLSSLEVESLLRSGHFFSFILFIFFL